MLLLSAFLTLSVMQTGKAELGDDIEKVFEGSRLYMERAIFFMKEAGDALNCANGSSLAPLLCKRVIICIEK